MEKCLKFINPLPPCRGKAAAGRQEVRRQAEPLASCSLPYLSAPAGPCGLPHYHFTPVPVSSLCLPPVMLASAWCPPPCHLPLPPMPVFCNACSPHTACSPSPQPHCLPPVGALAPTYTQSGSSGCSGGSPSPKTKSGTGTMSESGLGPEMLPLLLLLPQRKSRARTTTEGKQQWRGVGTEALRRWHRSRGGGEHKKQLQL